MLLSRTLRSLRSLSRLTRRIVGQAITPVVPPLRAPSFIEGLENRQLLSLTIDVRLPGGGKDVTVDQVGQVVNMDIYAIVSGSDADGANEALQSWMGSFLSTNLQGGAAKGDLFVNLTNTFSASGSSDSNHPTNVDQRAKTQDLDGDGDLDVGSNDNASATGYVVARAGSMQIGTGTVNGNKQEWKVGTMTFTVTSLLGDGATRVNYRRRDTESSGLWMEEFQIKTALAGDLKAGTPVTISNGNPGPTDDTPPTASLGAVSDITTAGNSAKEFTVTYTDADSNIDASTLNDADIKVTGPGAFDSGVEFVSMSGSGKTRTATYRLAARGGSWGDEDNGDYQIILRPNQVADIAGNTIDQKTLGSFSVNIQSVPSDTTKPTAALAPISTITTAGGANVQFTVNYHDNVAVDTSSLNDADIKVTGPGSFDSGVTLVSTSGSGTDVSATYRLAAPGGSWNAADNGQYTVALRVNQVSDTSDNFADAGSLGSFTVNIPAPLDTTKPTASLTQANNVTTAGATNYSFKVTYSDNAKVKRATIDNFDIKVTGPGGFSQIATLVSTDPASGDASAITATYSIVAKGGTWDSGDNGTYTVALQASQIGDTSNNFADAKNLGTFNVNIGVPKPTITLSDTGTLTVNGTDGSNTITLSLVKKQVRVVADGITRNFAPKQVKKIEVFGKAGNDTISAGSGIKNVFFDGGAGNDNLTGGPENDRVNGGDGDDIIHGARGNDIVDGGAGNDQLFGDDGNDKLIGAAGADVFNGGAGTDTADYSKYKAALTITIDNNANDGASGEGDNVKTDVENVLGGSGSDKITGSSANNVLKGNSGNDQLFGGVGNDVLEGGRGHDQLFGQDGADLLKGKDGEKDTLDGGAGADTAEADVTPKSVADVKINI
jgi:hypothetical protein